MEFCKQYNAATESQRGNIVPVEITGLRGPHLHLRHQDPAGALADQEGRRVEKGSGEPHKNKVGKLTREQVREIAQTKMDDLNANDIDAAEKIIAGTARSMGITTSTG